jgi:hypothetical protein
MITDKEIADFARKKVLCAIESALAKGMPLSRNTANRAIRRPHGFETCYWDYKKLRDGTITYTYAIDTLIIGTRVSEPNHQIFAVSKALSLPDIKLSQSIDYGLTGHSFTNCIQTNLSSELHILGMNIRQDYSNKFKQ